MADDRATGSTILRHYLVALVAVAVGLGLKFALNTLSAQHESPFLLLALIVIAAGWRGGLGPGMVATLLTTLGARWFFMEPRHSLALTDPGAGMNLLVFAIEAACIALLCEGRLWAVRQSEKAREELERRVAERTDALSQANAGMEKEVAERRRVEADVVRQREFLRALLWTLEEGIVATDESGRVVLVNRAAMEMYELPNENVPWEEWEKYHKTYHGDGVTEMSNDERPLVRVIRDRSLQDVEKSVVGVRSGRRRDLLSTGRVIVGPNGETVGAVVVFRDVTERKRREEERRRFMGQLERSNKELQDFASVASHDLQEPLRKIQAFGDRLRVKYEGQLGPEGQDYLARMLNAAGRMSTLISDLLTFSRVTTKAMPFRAVELAQVARDVASDLEMRAEQTGGRIEIGALPEIEADPLQMRQLLQNLMGNALKFHKPGRGTTVRVAGRVEEEDGGGAVCRLTVSDDGIGFDEKYLDRIFNVFQRLHGRNEYEGTGIGLAVCRKIAERHHGSVTARSVPGEGSTFVVTLPLKQPQQHEDHDVSVAASTMTSDAVTTESE